MFRIFILLAEAGVGGIFYALVSCLIEIRKAWWRRLLLLTGCALLVFMVIFTGDPAQKDVKPGVVVHAFNPSTWEAEAGCFLSSRPAWSTK